MITEHQLHLVRMLSWGRAGRPLTPRVARPVANTYLLRQRIVMPPREVSPRGVTDGYNEATQTRQL